MAGENEKAQPRVQGPGGMSIAAGAQRPLPLKLRVRAERSVAHGLTASFGLELDATQNCAKIAPFWRVRSSLPCSDRATLAASSGGVHMQYAHTPAHAPVPMDVTASVSVSYFGDILASIGAQPTEAHMQAACSASVLSLSNSALSLQPEWSLPLRRYPPSDARPHPRALSFTAPVRVHRTNHCYHPQSHDSSTLQFTLQKLCATLSL